MFLGRVVGSVVSTVRHPTYARQKLMLVRLTDPSEKPIGTTMLVVDAAGAGVGDRVLVASEGLGASEILGFDRPIPIREFIVGIVDRVDMVTNETRRS